MTCWFAPLILSNQHLAHPGDMVFRHACAMGLEGIVANAWARYISERSMDWLKFKNPKAGGGRGLGQGRV